MNPPPQFMDLIRRLLGGVGVGLLNGQFQENTGILKVFFQCVERINALAEQGAFFQNRRGGVRVVPEPVTGNFGFDLLESFLLAVQVKDTPSAGQVFVDGL
ncbi:hypothetical protein DSCOOX_54690 [Desulfosarcina ovata subsp. ovata]|uniref:Uncharacterized protein n=1 Tax=Desulfosarcina ovata subsp. ovata TaxID=2752305 RepID=A0A5K8AIH3_9BACT|nr:hypothetical protein DSCOOX_54690 [Desulfosarcina ovata subsp. ovata]